MTRREALRSLAAGASASALTGTALAASASPKPHADARLLALGAELKASWEKDEKTFATAMSFGGLTDKEANAVIEKTSQIVEEIIRERATSMEGVQVKMLAIQWCHGGECEAGCLFDGETTDILIARSLFRDFGMEDVL